MTVRCSEHKDCPHKKCPHYKEHEPMWGLEYIGGKGEVETCYCDKRTCGLRALWIEVMCLPVEKVKISEANQVAELVPA